MLLEKRGAASRSNAGPSHTLPRRATRAEAPTVTGTRVSSGRVPRATSPGWPQKTRSGELERETEACRQDGQDPGGSDPLHLRNKPTEMRTSLNSGETLSLRPLPRRPFCGAGPASHGSGKPRGNPRVPFPLAGPPEQKPFLPFGRRTVILLYSLNGIKILK